MTKRQDPKVKKMSTPCDLDTFKANGTGNLFRTTLVRVTIQPVLD